MSAIQATSSPKQDVKSKPSSSLGNIVSQSPKYETIFQPTKIQLLQPQPQAQSLQQFQSTPYITSLHQKPQYYPVQVLPKAVYVPQGSPHMIIIAQPALVPQSLLYGSQTQQLLNYFQNNPIAKQQLLYGNSYAAQAQPQAQIQQSQPTPGYMQTVLASPVGGYVLSSQSPYVVNPQYQATQQFSVPQYRQVAQHPQYSQFAQTAEPTAPTNPEPAPQEAQYAPQQHTTQLTNIAHLAQLAAQQYVDSPLKAAPAIVTGFEQFTPEQQAQIKAQLSTHLGSDFHAVTAKNGKQYSAKYANEQDSREFIPSPQVKSTSATTASSVGDIMKTRYVKSKN